MYIVHASKCVIEGTNMKGAYWASARSFSKEYIMAYGFLYASLRMNEVYWLSGKLRENVRFGISQKKSIYQQLHYENVGV